MIKKYNYLVFIIILFNLPSSYSQEKLPLQKVLIDVEKRFQCSFSYANEDVSSIRILPPDTELDFIETINYLEVSSYLTFNILENRFVTIINKRKPTRSICGYIVDIENQEPLQGVTIKTATKSVISNQKGYFELNSVTERDTIYIRHLGYHQLAKLTDELNTGGCKTLYLLPEIEQLETIIIKNFLTQGISRGIDGSLNIDYKKFGILPGLIENDALQTLQTLPGIQSLDETVTNINIRGGTHDQNLITWNGIKMYQSGHFFSYISAFDPNLIQKTTLLKNGTPAALTDGISGTIQMQSKEQIASEFNASLGFNFINAEASLDIPLSKKASLQIAGRRSYNDLLETQTYQNYFEKAFQNTEVVSNQNNVIEASDNFRFYDVGAIFQYEISSKDKVKASFIAMDNDFSFLESAIIDGEEQSRESNSIQRNMGGSIAYHRKWSEELSTDVEFYGVNYELKAGNVDILNNQKLTQENKVLESGIRVSADHVINKSLTILGGYDFIETGVSNLEETDIPFLRLSGKDLVRRHGLFSQVDYQLFKNSRIRTGLRLNYIEPFATFILEPRLNYSQGLSEFLWLDVSGEFKNQTITQTIDFQSDFLGVEKRRWILSNEEDVPILKSKQVSTGLTFKNKSWLCNTEIYFKNVDGIIARSQEFRNQYERSLATGSYLIKGIDFIVNKKIGRFSGWLSYSYADNDYTFETFQENIFPSNLDISHIFTFGTNYTNEGFKVSAGFNWRTGRPTTRPVPDNEVTGSRINYGPANSQVLSSYLRFDSSVTYNFKLTDKVKIHTGFSVWNLTNQNSVLSNYYEISDMDSPQEVAQNALQLTTNAVFKLIF